MRKEWTKRNDAFLLERKIDTFAKVLTFITN